MSYGRVRPVDVALFTGAGASIFLGYPRNSNYISFLGPERELTKLTLSTEIDDFLDQIQKILGSDIETIFEYLEKISSYGEIIYSDFEYDIIDAYEQAHREKIEKHNQNSYSIPAFGYLQNSFPISIKDWDNYSYQQKIAKFNALATRIISIYKLNILLKNSLYRIFQWNKENNERLITTYGPLLDLINQKNKNQIPVFTTNYDFIFEKAYTLLYCDSEYTFSNGFIFDTSTRNLTWKPNDFLFRKSEKRFNLFKIHGSISWKKVDESYIDIGTDNLTWDMSSVINVLSEKRNVFEQYKQPSDKIVIFPGAKLEMISRNEPFTTLYSFLEKYLYKISHLIIIGYSFRDEHINQLLQRAFIKKPYTIHLICKNKQSSSYLNLSKFFPNQNINLIPYLFNDKNINSIMNKLYDSGI